MRSYLFAVAILVLGAGSAFAKPADIQGVQWMLTHANGRTVPGSQAYIEFERNGQRFAGNTGCNRMFGTVEFRGRNIDLSAIGSTKRMCKLPAGSLPEMAFVNALDRASRYERVGNTLSLYDRQGRTLLRFKHLSKLPPIEEPSGVRGLDDSRWVLESIKGRRTFAPIKGAFINFDPVKRSAGGNSGCNVFGGEYTAKGSRITISDLVSTMRACVEDDRMTIEREFFDGLRAANRFEIKNGRLFLYKGPNLLLTLRGEPKS